MKAKPEKESNRLQFSPDWRVTVLVLLFLPLLLSLGMWQLDRADEKRQLQTLFAQRQANGPIAIEQLAGSQDLQFQPVLLTGEFINDKTLLLDNRIHHRRFGYEIISPFKLSQSNEIVLVNRGWLAGDISRRSLPVIEPINGEIQLVGEIYVPHSDMLMLAEDESKGWPRVLQSLDIEALQAEFKLPLFRYSVRLTQPSVASLQPNWMVVNLQPEKHTGYAVQWFSMSATLMIITFLANTNCWALIKRRKSR